jgi:hypothetical protein
MWSQNQNVAVAFVLADPQKVFRGGIRAKPKPQETHFRGFIRFRSYGKSGFRTPQTQPKQPSNLSGAKPSIERVQEFWLDASARLKFGRKL